MKTWFEWLERAGTRAENLVLMVLLLAMMGLATAQIVGRNLLGQSFILGEEALRLLVLWLTLAGAIAASRADRHVSISLLDRFLTGRPLQAARAATQGFTAAVCGLLAWHGLAFVRTSQEYGDTLLGSVPAWALQAILPIGFGLMAWRHAVHMARCVTELLGRKRESAE